MPSRLFSSLFGAAVLTIGLTEYRPALGGLGNLSDCLFLAAFLIWLASSFPSLEPASIARGLKNRNVRGFLLGGALLVVGGALASVGSDKAALSWSMTLKYALTFCVWLPWVTYVLERHVSLKRIQLLYLIGLTVVAAATMADVTVGTRFGLWLVSTPPEGAFEDLVHLRYAGPAGHVTTLGYITAIGILLAFSYIGARNSRRESIIGACSFVLCGGALLVSGSRAAMLGIAAGWVIILALGERADMRRILLLTGSSVALLLLVSRVDPLKSFVPVDPVQRLEESLAPRRDFEADWQRRRDLTSATVLLLHDPVTGYGMDNVGTSPSQSIGFNLHNTILQSWIAGGLLAGLGAVWLYWIVLSAGWTARRYVDHGALVLFAACVAFVTMDMVHPHFYMRFKWFAAALLMATLQKTSGQSLHQAEGPRSVAAA